MLVVGAEGAEETDKAFALSITEVADNRPHGDTPAQSREDNDLERTRAATCDGTTNVIRRLDRDRSFDMELLAFVIDVG